MGPSDLGGFARPAPSAMEVLESGEQGVLQWDRKLSELSEPGDGETLLYHTVRTQPGSRGARTSPKRGAPEGGPESEARGEAVCT